MALDSRVVTRFHGVLVEEILENRPEYLDAPFTVAEIYQALVPYRTHRDRIGVELNGDYEEALLHLLAGDTEYLVLDSPAARDHIRRELRSRNPNTGVFREFAALTVRLNPRHLDDQVAPAVAAPGVNGSPGDDEISSSAEAGGSTPADSSPADSSPAKGSPAKASRPTSEPPAPPKDAGSPEGSSMSQNVGGAQPASVAPPEDCPDCHRTLPVRAGLRFCPFCGVDVFVTSCSACGEELDRDWSFCIICGTPSGLEAGRAGG
jgi:hypothetical protein